MNMSSEFDFVVGTVIGLITGVILSYFAIKTGKDALPGGETQPSGETQSGEYT